jgi:hypothetical protein
MGSDFEVLGAPDNLGGDGEKTRAASRSRCREVGSAPWMSACDCERTFTIQGSISDVLGVQALGKTQQARKTDWLRVIEIDFTLRRKRFDQGSKYRLLENTK